MEEPRAASERQRDDVQLELIDEPRRQVLIDDARAAADDYVFRHLRALSAGRITRGLHGYR